MITEITLQNFKIFKEKTSFPLNQLNLLTGVNGGGKSTLLQSLLIMRQSVEHNERMYGVLFNGNCVELGTFRDIKNSDTSRRIPVSIGFNVELLNWQGSIRYDLLESKNMIGYIENIFLNTSYNKENITNPNLIPNIELRKLIPFTLLMHLNDVDANMFNPNTYEQYETAINFDKIHYIAADRIGPKKYYEKHTLGNFINVGARGEYTANVLHQLEDETVHDKLYLGNDSKTLIQQTEEWLGKIFGKAKIEIKGKEKEHTVLNLLLNTSASEHRYRPSNVGFGYTYVLPIIVSGLIAKEGEILIVENPEAHLHPKAQSELTKFLARVASCGVQVFIESHSEHILNGIRIATLQQDIEISNKQVSVLYFHNQNNSYFEQLKIEPNGKIKNWVDGFFDQQEIDLAEIFRLGKNKS